MIGPAYKTTKYNLTLFLECIKTNHGYSVVADFIIQDEASSTIEEATIIKSWNFNWKPNFLCLTTAGPK